MGLELVVPQLVKFCLFDGLIEEATCYLDFALIFVDFRKDFDSIDRSRMFDILKLCGIPDLVIEAISIIH